MQLSHRNYCQQQLSKGLVAEWTFFYFSSCSFIQLLCTYDNNYYYYLENFVFIGKLDSHRSRALFIWICERVFFIVRNERNHVCIDVPFFIISLFGVLRRCKSNELVNWNNAGLLDFTYMRFIFHSQCSSILGKFWVFFLLLLKWKKKGNESIKLVTMILCIRMYFTAEKNSHGPQIRALTIKATHTNSHFCHCY